MPRKASKPKQENGLAVRYRPLAELQPYENNPKRHPPAQVDAIARSIQEFGFTAPVLIDGDGSVVAGHGRLEAAAQIGLDSVPTILLDGLTPEQVAAYRIADNRLSEMGGWDDHLLATELLALSERDFDLDHTAFEAQDVLKLMHDLNPPADEEETPAAPASKPGDVWTLGDHQLTCGDGDCTDADVVVASWEKHTGKKAERDAEKPQKRKPKKAA